MKLLLLCCLIAAAVSAAHIPDDLLDEDAIIKKVEASNALWKAGRNFGPNTKYSYIKRLMGMKKSNHRRLPVKFYSEIPELPEEFDARKQWPGCETIGHIRDQGDCGSCWAVATAGAFTDRYCIASGQNFTLPLSDEDMLSCSGAGSCDGGYPDEAWETLMTDGLVTGGDYESDIGCQPYELQKCEHHINGSLPSCSELPTPETPPCEKKCSNPGYKTPYAEDHHYATSAYSLQGVDSIKTDIMNYGSVGAGFYVYEDFLTYKSGVYHATTPEILGLHVVRIIGWGKEDGTPYWLVANSWNEDWGDKGFFKILLGEDECGIESEISAGLAKVQ